jgi:fatty-acyl-CoA synthase
VLHADVLRERARLTPDKTALVCVPQGVRYTYRELDERVDRLVSAWHEACGFVAGDRVALLAHNRVEFIDAFFAAARSGIILVPLGTRLTPHEIQFIVTDAGLRGFMYGGAFAETVRALNGPAAIEHWIALDDCAAENHTRLSDLLAAAAQGFPAPSPVEGSPAKSGALRSTRPGPEDICCLLYTSGTTGKPKGVMVPHRMVAWNGYNTTICWQLREDDVSPIFTPLYHAGGLGAFLLPVFTIGGTIVLHAGFDPDEIWRTIERERCTVVLGVPTIYKLLMEAPAFKSADLSHVRWFISGGAPLPLYIIEAYQTRGVTFKQGYGLTEVGVNCFSMTVEESLRKKGSIGKPMMFTEARAAAADGTEAHDGEVGELWLRGPHVCKGYWNNPEATAAALDAEGWFHTGDLARRDEDGFFYIAGRQKDMLISGGVNVYPAEIEAELLLHPAVRDAAVVGVPDPTWGEIGAGCVVLRDAGSVTGEDLAVFLARTLAKYKIPRRWLFLESLPRSPYGKVVKGELQRLDFPACGKSSLTPLT